MKYTNKQNLPHAVMLALKDDRYDRGKADISVTELIDAPRIRIMKQKYGDKVSMDVAMAVMSLMGTSFHSLMEREREPDDLAVEERLFHEDHGWVWSGQIDRIQRHRSKLLISDWKVCQVHALGFQQNSWASQLNLYGMLVERNYGEFPDLQVVAYLRDWNAVRASKVPSYPQAPILAIKQPKWRKKVREQYLEARMQAHKSAQHLFDATGNIIECSPEERWHTGKTYALMKSGSAKAIKIFNTPTEAATARSGRPGYHIETRDGEEKRCELHCEFSSVCDQWIKIRDDRIVRACMDKINNPM